MAKSAITAPLQTQSVIADILAAALEREREREILARRYGLFERRETLEQIGELLGITRERVRQLEKAIMARLKTATGQGKVPQVMELQARLITHIRPAGNAVRLVELTEKLTGETSRDEQSRIAFLAQLCPGLVVTDEDSDTHAAVAARSPHDEKQLKKLVGMVVTTIKDFGEVRPIADIAQAAGIKDPKHAAALAHLSKHLAMLNGSWGLLAWPMVNPRNIRDKIYLVLSQHGTHMHFKDIAATIKQSEFRRKDVTTQAIHNELIKDERFVLIGRGIYALTEWGYAAGTVSDIITTILREEGAPLHRDEIVRRVLATRYVKETTVLLNLQAKGQFKRVAKAMYALVEPAEAAEAETQPQPNQETASR